MGFVSEFKEFIQKGNAMDMAVGVIIGGAFTAIVTSLTDDIINPLLKLVLPSSDVNVAGLTIPVPGTENGIDFGAFISAIINFLIIAIIIFCIVKAMNNMSKASKKALGKEEVEADPAPVCPYCLEEIKEGTTRCPHCAGEFAEKAPATGEAKAK